MSAALAKVCPGCGAVATSTWCAECKPVVDVRRPSRAAGYDAAWDRLSRRARTLQPWCTDCGTADDLTADHLPEAWERKAKGLAVRLQDVEVVCRSCNSRRGAARGVGANRVAAEPRRQAKFGSHTPGGYL